MFFREELAHEATPTEKPLWLMAFEILGHMGVFFSLLAAAGCADQGYYDENNGYGQSPGSNNATFDQGGGGGGNVGQDMGPPFIPELEEDFVFSQPAVVGEEVFIANETLNSVAVIDSTSLAIRTIPVGFRPTEIVGPEPGAQTDASRVFALNQGSHSVSVIDPQTHAVRDLAVMPGANKLVASPNGEAAIAWYDDAAREEGDRAGDLSSVTLLREGAAYAIAVGFHVRRVHFVPQRERVLILSDDGVSVVEMDQLMGDRAVPPIAVLPRELRPQNPYDLEVLLDERGQFAIARVASFKGVVITDLESREQHVIRLPEIPTDIDIAERDVPEVLIMLPYTHAALRLTLPEGAMNAAALTLSPDGPESPDMGADMSDDMGTPEDMTQPIDMMNELDMGVASDMSDMSDMTLEDMPLDDMSPDLAFEEMGVDMAEEDMTPSPAAPFMLEGPGIQVLTLPEQVRLGAAAISQSGDQALLYTTIGQQVSLAQLFDLRDGSQRDVRFEKGIRGVSPDQSGSTFLVFHSRVEGAPESGTRPEDALIARSWGLSVLDVASATPRLVLTEHEPWRATLWSVTGYAPRAYVIFKRPVDDAFLLPTHRDVLGVNLETFSIDSFRIPSPPEGIGAVPSSARVYINQTHPQGRITFVDVVTERRQTVTGYQLNSKID